MEYIITEPTEDQFWTGDRFSPHIIEAMRYPRQKIANAVAGEIAERMGLQLRVREAPENVRPYYD